LPPAPRSTLFPYTTLFRSEFHPEEMPHPAINLPMPAATPISPWHWVAFIGGVLVFVLLDLFVFHRGNRPVTMKNALFWTTVTVRSEEHTSELQSRSDLVCR